MSHVSVLLVVEDEPFIRISIADSLKDAGFFVLEAEDAAEAMAILEARDDVGIVFSDIDLGSDVDGIALLRMIADRWPPIRLFATSGRVPHRVAGQLPPAATFFPKPYSEGEIIDAFRASLAA